VVIAKCHKTGLKAERSSSPGNLDRLRKQGGFDLDQI
jgi:hypothetical protein